MKSKLAKGSNYFDRLDFPICIKKIEPDTKTTHNYDLTFINHFHDFSELVLVIKGSGVQVIKGISYQVSVGDVFLLKDNDEHHFISQENIGIINIMFDEKALKLPEKLLEAIPSYKAIFELEPILREKHKFSSHLKLPYEKLLEVAAVANQIEVELESKQPGYQAAVYSYLTLLVASICREYSHIKTVKGKSLLRVSEVISKLEQDFNKNWTLQELSKIACMSENNLLLVFKEATGMSPIAYGISIKIKMAAMLLKSTSLNITQIALQCGFNDSNYFSRLFKKEFNLTPKNYRKTMI